VCSKNAGFNNDHFNNEVSKNAVVALILGYDILGVI
tara:strand:+ start:857 stop:964 length:108 start_codon:yes stop_codon:yes gene_type:complete